jgi:hypothetical protein
MRNHQLAHKIEHSSPTSVSPEVQAQPSTSKVSPSPSPPPVTSTVDGAEFNPVIFSIIFTVHSKLTWDEFLGGIVLSGEYQNPEHQTNESRITDDCGCFAKRNSEIEGRHGTREEFIHSCRYAWTRLRSLRGEYGSNFCYKHLRTGSQQLVYHFNSNEDNSLILCCYFLDIISYGKDFASIDVIISLRTFPELQQEFGSHMRFHRRMTREPTPLSNMIVVNSADVHFKGAIKKSPKVLGVRELEVMLRRLNLTPNRMRLMLLDGENVKYMMDNQQIW